MVHPSKKLKSVLPSKLKEDSVTKAKETAAKQKRLKAEAERQALLKSKDKERLHAILTGEGLEELSCEACATTLRFRVCINPGCRHINPRAPRFLAEIEMKEGDTKLWHQ